MTKFETFRNKAIFLKICLGRGINYVNLLNAGMILYLFLSDISERGLINLNTEKYIILIYVVGFVILMTIGVLEVVVFKGIQTEQNYATRLNPELMEMKEIIKDIQIKVT